MNIRRGHLVRITGEKVLTIQREILFSFVIETILQKTDGITTGYKLLCMWIEFH